MVSEEYGVGYTTKNNCFCFDKEDYDKIKGYCWNINPDGYIVSYLKNKTLLFHRVVMDCNDSNLEVDHIHGKETRNDNRKENLRLATCSQN